MTPQSPSKPSGDFVANVNKKGSKPTIGSKVKQESPIQSKPPAPEKQFALSGKCPVTLIKEGKWVAGNTKFGCVHRGKTYLFGTQAKVDEFMKDPESFSPLLAGFDPVIFHQHGKLVDGKEKHGAFMGKAPKQKIVLFSSQETRQEFQKNPKKYMSTVRMAIAESDRMK